MRRTQFIESHVCKHIFEHVLISPRIQTTVVYDESTLVYPTTSRQNLTLDVPLHSAKPAKGTEPQQDRWVIHRGCGEESEMRRTDICTSVTMDEDYCILPAAVHHLGFIVSVVRQSDSDRPCVNGTARLTVVRPMHYTLWLTDCHNSTTQVHTCGVTHSMSETHWTAVSYVCGEHSDVVTWLLMTAQTVKLLDGTKMVLI